jgi:hypothetical protein
MAETNTDKHVDDQQRPEQYKPIVLELKKKKKKSKKRYTKELEEVQRMEGHLTRSAQRMARATEKGITSYRKLSKKSAGKKKDGAIRDFIPNSGIAMSHSLREASQLPYDIAQAMDTPQNRKRLKRQLRGISRSLRISRW